MGKVVLVVDDSESILEIVSFTLENNDFEVLKAKDGKDALKHFDGANIDLLVTDLHMPVMNGIELIKEVRAMPEYKHIPILFLTTETQVAKKIEAKKAGATGWLIKPFNAEKLITTIKKVLR